MPTLAFDQRYRSLLDRWPSTTHTRDLASAFGRTRVTIAGPADAPALVLLHGGGATSMVWTAQVAELAADHRVYAIDQVGDPGMSTPGDRPMTRGGDLVSWLDGVLDALELPLVALCGHSSGGWLAILYTLARRDRVSSVTLLDPTQCFAGLSTSYLMHAVPFLRQPSAAAARRLLEWESAGTDVDPDWSELYALGADLRPRAKTIVARRPPDDMLEQLPVPVQVVVAGNSRVHKSATVATSARKRLPNNEIAEIPAAAHHSLMFHPDVAELVVSFAQRTQRPGR